MMDHMFHEKVSEFFSLENLDEDDLQDLAASSSTLKVSLAHWTTLSGPHFVVVVVIVVVVVVVSFFLS